MLLADVNALLAAHRDDHRTFRLPAAGSTRPWTTSRPSGWRPSWWAPSSRLATHRRVFPTPTPRAAAFAFLDALIAQPGCLLISPGPRHVPVLRRMCEEADATGDLMPDAVLAAIAVEQGAEVVTFDRDFARFPSVRHRLLGT